ncbi:neuroparsin-A-like [Homarus americanus]|uniref:Neuroparsin 3-like n=1 Tax=Homarus americanus TaxID=6706 RepID=A0A8J5TIL1_HOMAM|nr:neuroparsin-A-like [Homarus americanus]KAG7172727.1 neuroparsin 3-like [Homarus americanus]
MRSLGFVTSIAVIVVIVIVNETGAAPRCNQGGNRLPANNCKYGTVVDWCGGSVCAKGPGEACGGEWSENGECGAGTYCSCGYCNGCSANLECWFGSYC